MFLLKTIYFVSIVTFATLFYASWVALLSFAYFLLRKPFPTDKGHRIGIRWGQTIMALTPGWRVQISGKEHIPHSKIPVVIVANHESAADIFAVFLLAMQFKWLAKKELFDVPILGFCMRKLGYIAVKRGDKSAHVRALKECDRWIRNGFSVLFFPEGTRSLDGKPKKFKIGAFKLASDTKSSILPVVLSGSGKLLRKGSLCPNSATLKIRVLPLVALQEAESVDAFTLRVQELIVAEHTKLSHENKS